MIQYIGFMAHLPETEFDYLIETLKEYNIAGYIVSHEAKPYSHFHFVVEMSDTDYHSFAQRVFKKKHGLRGRAVKGDPRQYGRLKKIENLQRLKAYTIKDGNYRTNLSLVEINTLKEISFAKDETLTKKDVVIATMEEEGKFWKNFNMNSVSFLTTAISYTEIIKKIINKIIDIIITTDTLGLNKLTINSILLRYISKTEHLTKAQKSSLIFQFQYQYLINT
jgi:hypothetical protein